MWSGLLISAVFIGSNVLGNDIGDPLVPLIPETKPDIHEQILNGRKAQEDETPYIASITIDERTQCTGTLISPNSVLTAAHCLSGESFIVMIGAADYESLDGINIQIVDKSNVRVHPHYDDENILNDIGIIKLPEPVQVTEKIKIMELPQLSQPNDFANTLAYVSGWGVTDSQKKTLTDKLLTADVKVVPQPFCRFYSWRYGYQLQQSQICSFYIKGAGPCFGDSGGPLYVKKGNSAMQIGITSFVFGKCQTTISFYTFIGQHLPWILSNMA